MTIHFTKFTAKPATLEAIKVTEDILDELAAWLGAGFYTVRKTVVGGTLSVVFHEPIPEEKRKLNYPPEYGSRIVTVDVGDYILKHPEGFDQFGEPTVTRYYPITQADLDAFVKQQRENGEVDISAPPYDR